MVDEENGGEESCGTKWFLFPVHCESKMLYFMHRSTSAVEMT